jgi:hypothetical protein
MCQENLRVPYCKLHLKWADLLILEMESERNHSGCRVSGWNFGVHRGWMYVVLYRTIEKWSCQPPCFMGFLVFERVLMALGVRGFPPIFREKNVMFSSVVFNVSDAKTIILTMR